jgi:opacity protein-like surface antigen
MRRLLVAFALIGFVSEAFAGEFEMPVLRGASDDYAPSPYIAAPPIYTRWSGFYAGGQISGSIAGIGFGSSVRSLVNFAVRNSILQNHVTNWTALGKGDTSDTGFGGFVGYNYQWDDVTLGLEANYTRTSLTKSASDSMSRSILDNSNAPAGHNYTYDATVSAKAAITLTDFATLRARGGWAAGNFMPYGFAGVAVARANVNRSATVTANRTDSYTTTTVVGFDPITGVPITVSTPQSVTSTLLLPGTQVDNVTGAFAFGYTAGFGMDVLVTPNIFVRGEYEFVQFPNIKAVSVNINTVRLGGGVKF